MAVKSTAKTIEQKENKERGGVAREERVKVRWGGKLQRDGSEGSRVETMNEGEEF